MFHEGAMNVVTQKKQKKAGGFAGLLFEMNTRSWRIALV